MNKRISLGSSITFMLIAATITFCLTMVFSTNIFNDKVNSLKERELLYEKIAEIDKIVRSNYNKPIDSNTLFDGLSKGYFNGLGDEYCYYMTKDEYKEYLKETDPNAVGIGITAFKEASGYIKIADVQTGSPAEKANLMVNDLIISINGTKSTKDNAETLIKSLKDQSGTVVDIVYRRDGIDTPVQIVRKQFDVKTVLTQTINNVGYIKVTEFNEKTPNQFKIAVDELTSQNVSGIIFDIRNNNIGSITSVSECLDYLIPEGPIATAEFRDGTTEVKTKSSPGEINLPMTVLTNEKTAGAAELFTVTLKDYGKAKQVGATTKGKGIIQEIIKLQDGSAINLTIAKLKPLKSENFNGKGLAPDFVQLMPDDLISDINNMNIETDPQLKKSYDILMSTIKPNDPITSQEPSMSTSTEDSTVSSSDDEQSPSQSN